MKSHRTLARLSAAPRLAVLLAALLALIAGAPAPAQPNVPQPDGAYPGDYGDPQGYDGSYGYVRTLDGSATLTQGDTGDRDELRINQPVLVGDRIWVSPRGRAEVVLADGNLLRIDAESEVVFDALAGSPDREDRTTVLRVLRGNVQLVVVPDFLGEGLPRVDTPNATVYANDLGAFRITTDAGDWTEVVVREGEAEVITRTDSLRVREGEGVVVEGSRRTVERVTRAGALDSLELWGDRLDREARQASVPYVDESLQYEAAHLDRYGSWVSIEGRHAWRPRVGDDWRPYWQGRWAHSPAGFTWVSYEPWGWVPYHYGTWDHVPGYGWAWFPGHRFSPAWVYWHWTDHYVGWVPVGYYTHHYYPRFGFDVGFRFGHYGWAGGSWGHYRHWNFLHLGYFGRHLQHHHVYRGDRFGTHHRYAVPRRGLVTTDTRGVPRTAMRRPQQVAEVLSARARTGRGDLPDVTSFVARDELGREARARILVDRREGAGATRVIDADDLRGAVRRARPGDRDELATKPRVIDRGSTPDRAEAIRRARPGDRNQLETRPGVVDRGSAPDRAEAIRRARPNDRNELETRPGVVDRGTAPDRAEAIRRARPDDRNEVETRPGVIDRRPGQDRARDRADGSWRDRHDRGTSARDRTPVSRRVIEGVRSGSGSRSTRDRSPGASDRSSPTRDRIERRPGVVRDRSPDRSRTTREGSRSRPDSVRDRSPSRSPRERSTRGRESSPPPRSSSSASSRSPSRRSSGVSSRSSSRSRSSGASSRSSNRSRSSGVSSRSSSRSSGVSSRSSSRSRSSGVSSRSGSRSRSSGVSSRSSSRSRSSGARSSGSSRSSGRSSKGRGRPPAM